MNVCLECRQDARRIVEAIELAERSPLDEARN